MKNIKNTILVVGLLGTLILSILFLLSRTGCYSENWCHTILDIFSSDNFSILFLTPPLFILSLLTYKLREEVFRAWLHFTYWWVPLSIVITLLLSVDSGGGGFGVPNLLPAEGVAAFFAIIFTIVSLIIIAWKYFAQPAKH